MGGYLLMPILLPLIGGLISLFVPKKVSWARGVLTLLFLSLSLLFGIRLFLAGNLTHNLRILSRLGWIGSGLDLALFANQFSSFILVAVILFGLLITLYSLRRMKKNLRENEYYAYLSWSVGLSALAVLSDNLLVFLLAWGALAVLLYLLISLGKEGSALAANKALVMVGGSDVLMLVGALIVYQLTNTLRMSEIGLPLSGTLPVVAFLLFLVGALTKAGAVPFHTWIPDSAEFAPVEVLAFLPASLDKLLGIYLLARLSLDLFILSPNSALSIVLMAIGTLTIIAAVMMAMMQKNLMKLLSFHAVSQVGYMVLGIGTGIPLGIVGGLFHMLNNALYKTSLFLGAGAVEEKTGETNLENLGGLARVMPLTFIAFLVSSLAISGVPPLNGFFSKYLIYQGVFELKTWYFPIFLTLAMLGSVLTLAYFLKVLHSVFFGERPKRLFEIKEVGLEMVLPMIIFSLFCIFFGLFPLIPVKAIFGPIVGLAEFPTLAFTGLPLILIIAALSLGLLLYFLTLKGKTKTSEVFVGGEAISQAPEAFVTLPDGGEMRTDVIDLEAGRFPGTFFYDSVKSIRLLNELYKIAEARFFDIYERMSKIGSTLVRASKALHTGFLTTYLGWLFLGGAILLFFFFLNLLNR